VKATNHVECPPKEKHVRSECPFLVKINPGEGDFQVVATILLDQCCNPDAFVFFVNLGSHLLCYIISKAKGRCGVLHKCFCKANFKNPQLDGKVCSELIETGVLMQTYG